MRYVTSLILPIILSVSQVTASQEYEISEDSIKNHISILAHDSLEGRQVGDTGEWRAAQYIVSVFKSAGLEPKGDNGGYLQAFEFNKRTDFGPNNRLVLNGQTLEIGTDYQPLPHSTSNSFAFGALVDVGYGIISDDSSHSDYADLDVNGRAVLIARYTPEADDSDTIAFDPELDRYSSLTNKIMTAIDQGATGLFFYTPESYDDSLTSGPSMPITPKDVPIIFLKRHALERLGLDLSKPAITDAAGLADLVLVKDTGYNVVGFLPGVTDTVSIIGAHYDHIGWGGFNSRYQGEPKKIHNGADDNASGTAALLELARKFGDRKLSLHHSILFIAFSGEEFGTLGSSHYVRHWTVDKDKARLMLNIDMIGRLSEQEKGLGVLGTGTCPEFKSYFAQKDLGDLKVTFNESGSGPSDHAAFYNDSIPCLHFFTGAHEDYHTPEDDIENIDVPGVAAVANLVADIVTYFDSYPGPLTFERTKDEAPGGRRAGMRVTLGIMPDYVSQVKGLAIDGISKDKAAERAGLLKGDIIIGIDRFSIGDIYDYMNVMKKFRPDTDCDVRIVRGTDTLNISVHFD